MYIVMFLPSEKKLPVNIFICKQAEMNHCFASVVSADREAF